MDMINNNNNNNNNNNKIYFLLSKRTFMNEKWVEINININISVCKENSCTQRMSNITFV